MKATANELTELINYMQWFVSVCVEPNARIKKTAAPSTQRGNPKDSPPLSAEEIEAAAEEQRMRNAEVERARGVMRLFEHAIEEVEVVRAEVRIAEDKQRRENQEAQAIARHGRRRARVR